MKRVTVRRRGIVRPKIVTPGAQKLPWYKSKDDKSPEPPTTTE